MIEFNNFPPSHTSPNKGPTVLVLQVDHHVGLTIVRALGMAGVFCLGISFEGRSYGCHSKFLKGYAAFIPKDNQDRIDKTVELIGLVKPDYVMAMSESLLEQLNSVRNVITSETKLLFASQEILDGAFNKARTLSHAQQLNIPTPQTYSTEDILDTHRLPEGVTFPVVLKPPRPYLENPWKQHSFRYKYCYSLNELLSILEKFRGAPFLPLVQEFCPGHGVGVELCMYRGKVVAAFQHARIREWPPSGGAAVMRTSVPLDNAMYSDSVKLLQALHWEGVAMIEFRQDPVTNKYWFMEINGRFWGSLALPIVCGVNFPLVLLQTMGLAQDIKSPILTYPVGVSCRQLSADIHWLWDVMFKDWEEEFPGKKKTKFKVVVEFILDFFRVPYYDIEWMEDPWPGIFFWKIKIMERIYFWR